jgi:hypothetical protein
MCFAASVSFLMGSVLGVVGVASATMAYRSNKKWIAFALIPLMSGIQQIIEGIVWIQLNNGNLLGAHFYPYS